MTVAELIAELQKVNGALQVAVPVDTGDPEESADYMRPSVSMRYGLVVIAGDEYERAAA